MGSELQILITAGGTSEYIDDVRRITNSGTGALGAKIAEAFAEAAPGCRIAYVCSEKAVRPQIAESVAATCKTTVDIHVADNINTVRDMVCRICEETPPDVIIHSMAIGDYQVRAVSDVELITASMIERLSVLACGDSSSPEEAVKDALLSPPEINEAKISSDRENLIVVLEKAPKIIALFRGLTPEAVIVGFKLLADASEADLIQAGQALLEKNDCDFVLANDMSTVRGGADSHRGLLITKDKTFEWATGKNVIAGLVVKHTLKSLRTEN